MIVVGPAKESEADRLVRLAQEVLPRDIDPAWLLDEIAGSACMVARDSRSDEVLGFALARREAPCQGHIWAMAVDRMHRNEGVGSALLKGVEDVMMRSGAMQLRLEVRMDNQRAQAFYGRHGFAPEGLHEGAYSDGADALSLARPL